MVSGKPKDASAQGQLAVTAKSTGDAIRQLIQAAELLTYGHKGTFFPSNAQVFKLWTTMAIYFITMYIVPDLPHKLKSTTEKKTHCPIDFSLH